MSARNNLFSLGLDDHDRLNAELGGGIPPGSIGYVNLPVFGGVVAASLLFAPLGAIVAHKLPDQLLRRLFAVFLFVLAGRMSFNLL